MRMKTLKNSSLEETRTIRIGMKIFKIEDKGQKVQTHFSSHGESDKNNSKLSARVSFYIYNI